MHKINFSILIGLIFSLSSSMALADHRYNQRHANKHFGFAKVIMVDPIYKTVTFPHQRKSCRNEIVTYNNQSHGSGGMLAGGIIGGIIGSKLGRGHKDRHVATALGTLIGAAVGQDAASHQHTSDTVVERRCRRITEYSSEQRIVGYHVEYRYRGDIFYTRMQQRPGPRIRVKVQVIPVEF